MIASNIQDQNICSIVRDMPVFYDVHQYIIGVDIFISRRPSRFPQNGRRYQCDLCPTPENLFISGWMDWISD